MPIFLIVIVVICWGIWGFAEKKALQHGTAWQTLFVSLVLKTLFSLPVITLILYLTTDWQGFFIKASVWFWMFFAVLVNGIAIVLIRFALLRGGAGLVIALTAVYPIITMILALVFLKEYLSAFQLAGIGITTLGVVLLNL